MKKNAVALLVFFAFCSVVYGESIQRPEIRKNAIWGELGGNGVLLSVHYGRVMVQKDRYFIAGQVGVGPIPIVWGAIISHQVTFNLGKRTSFLEIGLGGTYLTWGNNFSYFSDAGHSYADHSYNISPILGYRFQSGKGFLLRAYLNPIINLTGAPFYSDYLIVPYLGVGLGYAF